MIVRNDARTDANGTNMHNQAYMQWLCAMRFMRVCDSLHLQKVAINRWIVTTDNTKKGDA